MKTRLSKRLFGAAWLLLAFTCAASAQAGTCSNASLRGNYGFTISGEILPAPGAVLPVAGVAMTHFDGKGNLSQVDFVMRGGSSAAPPGSPLTDNGFRSGETGTYTVNSDCTGLAAIHFSDGSEIDLKLVVVSRGGEIHTVVSALKTPTGATLPSAVRSDALRVGPADEHDED
jgi:hypothetical protein